MISLGVDFSAGEIIFGVFSLAIIIAFNSIPFLKLTLPQRRQLKYAPNLPLLCSNQRPQLHLISCNCSLVCR